MTPKCVKKKTSTPQHKVKWHDLLLFTFMCYLQAVGRGYMCTHSCPKRSTQKWPVWQKRTKKKEKELWNKAKFQVHPIQKMLATCLICMDVAKCDLLYLLYVVFECGFSRMSCVYFIVTKGPKSFFVDVNSFILCYVCFFLSPVSKFLTFHFRLIKEKKYRKKSGE